jgi:hypothetical protein
MDKEFRERFAKMEEIYPGITKQIWHFENMTMPQCPFCDSEDTAIVQIGVIGRTIHIKAGTRKIKLLLNGPRPGDYYCYQCEKYFTPDENSDQS